jgi:hypothetical protein
MQGCLLLMLSAASSQVREQEHHAGSNKAPARQRLTLHFFKKRPRCTKPLPRHVGQRL